MVAKLLITPFQKFVRIESLSGILLFGSTLLALLLANSQFGEQFQSLWNYKIGISSPGFELVKPLKLWINDGLMTVFFFLIGLEIKRELLIGELNTIKKAAFPLFAAAGGMLVPVLLFFVFNKNHETADGWGIPMATDIAFSLAILGLLGKRVPLGLKVFLTAFAIVDDLGAVLIIAIFYSASIKWSLILIALGMLGLLFYLSYRNIYDRALSWLFGLVIWYLFLKAGIHPTIAGVLMALTIPIRQRVKVGTYADKLTKIAEDFKSSGNDHSPLLTKEQIEEIDNLEDWTEKVQSPLQHLEHKLHPWVAYFIMPVFALTNSGVVFKSETGLDTSLSFVILISMVLGNLLGIVLMSWLGVKLKLADLPAGVNFRQILGIGLLAGVGFTMSIFIANLAFSFNPLLLDSAKVGILLGSAIAGLSGYLFLRLTIKPVND